MHKRSMSVVSPRYSFRRIASRSIVATSLLAIGSAWAGGPPGKEISLVNISRLAVNSASAFHRIAVSRRDPNLVAVAWREYGLPINTNAGAGPGERTADCHVSVSTDGGSTFHDTNLMPILRQNTGDPELPSEPAPGLWYCNAPWVTIGDDRTIYAGGSVFTPLGDRNWYPARGTDAPKQGRALVTVSTDNGQSWSPPTFGIRISRREMGDPDTERGRTPALSVIRRYRDQRAPLLRRVSPACGVPVSVPQWGKHGSAGIDRAIVSDGDPGR